MEILTEEDLNRLKAEAEVIRKQQQDWLKEYQDKSRKLQMEIKDLELKKKNAKQLFDTEFSHKVNEISQLEEELRSKIYANNEINIKITSDLREAQARLDNAREMESSLQNRHQAHTEMVSNHNINTSLQQELMLQKESTSADREERSKVLLNDAKLKLESHLAMHKELEEKSIKINKDLISIKEESAKLEKIKKHNMDLLKEIEDSKQEIISINLKIEGDKREIITIRSSNEEILNKISLKEKNISEREASIRAAQIRCEVMQSNLVSKEREVNEQIGKLSQLKTDVEFLLEKKEAKGV